MKVAIDASRVRSGGGIAHLIGILSASDSVPVGIAEVHVWAYRSLLDRLPNHPWIVKHHPKAAERSVLAQLYWQATKLADEIRAAGCDILFAADASTLCRFTPMVVLNQNMLPYEDGMVSIFGWTRERLRQHFIHQVQKLAFKAADGNIFLTNYAATQVKKHTGPINSPTCIAHGVDALFVRTQHTSQWPASNERPIRCVYVSPIYEYKYQWVVVRAIKLLRDRGMNIELDLVGGGGARARRILAKQIRHSDPDGQFVKVEEFLPHAAIAERLSQCDIFVFASGCETFGISLLEAMTVGLPIACSNRSSLPETLQNAGVYFDPEDDASVAQAVNTLIQSADLREQLSLQAKELARHYSWEKCATQTWAFLRTIYEQSKLSVNA
jgi:glycosyltransferase involved in cell wall biosynthesis